MGEGAEFQVYKRLDMEVVSGDGARVTTADGRQFIDFYGGHAVASLGYGDRGLIDALTRQAEHIQFQTNAVEMEVRPPAHPHQAAGPPPPRGAGGPPPAPPGAGGGRPRGPRPRVHGQLRGGGQ